MLDKSLFFIWVVDGLNFASNIQTIVATYLGFTSQMDEGSIAQISGMHWCSIKLRFPDYIIKQVVQKDNQRLIKTSF